MAQEYGRYFGLKVGVFRGGCLTGPQHSGVELHGFLSYLVKAALTGTTYRIFGYKGKQVRDNIHCRDVLPRRSTGSTRRPRPGEVYNLGGGRGNSCSILEAAAMVEELGGGRLKTEYVDAEPRRRPHLLHLRPAQAAGRLSRLGGHDLAAGDRLGDDRGVEVAPGRGLSRRSEEAASGRFPMSTTMTRPAVAPPVLYRLALPMTRSLPYGRYRLMHWLVRKWPVSPFVATLGRGDGLRFECDVRIAASREAYFIGRYEPQETCVARSILRPGDVFVDVGDNCGYFTLLAAGLVGPSGRIVAVEAHPEIYETLRRSLGLNHLPYVTALNVAVADGPGTLSMSGDAEATALGMARVVADGAPGAGLQVRADALDALLDEAGVDAVDLLKMDIEGARSWRSRGWRRAWPAGAAAILLELHPRQIGELGGKLDAIYAALTGAGYVGRSLFLDRRPAYHRNLQAADLLRPFDPAAELGDWPHQLWSAPGVPPLAGAAEARS